MNKNHDDVCNLAHSYEIKNISFVIPVLHLNSLSLWSFAGDKPDIRLKWYKNDCDFFIMLFALGKVLH